MRCRSLFKYFSERKWADAFLEGDLLFRSLSYFRDYEDDHVREDQNEGRAIFRPDGGLIVNNLTQKTTFSLPGHAFESAAKQSEIFVFCASRSFTEEMREQFQAIACVEILDIPRFCESVAAALPASATFPGRPGRRRIGNRVEYYRETEGGSRGGHCQISSRPPSLKATRGKTSSAWCLA